MTDAERQAMVEFFGTIHAQAKQTDQAIVESSRFVRPISEDIKVQLQQALQPGVAAPHIPQAPNHFVQMPQQGYEHVPLPPPPTSDAIQLELPFNAPNYNDDILKVLRDINFNLKKISSILEKNNGTTEKTTNK